MSMSNDSRVALATWMGWRLENPYHTHGKCSDGKRGTMRWVLPNKCGQICHEGNMLDVIPDPANNAADCESLIRKLNEEGYQVSILTTGDGDLVQIIEPGSAKTVCATECDDWKAGVVELAMKVIADE